VRTWLIGISTDECACAHLLSASGLGRLAVIVNGRPQIFPVNHVYDRPSGCVVFPTRAGTKLHGALDWPWVGFEVDGLDRDGGGGWSVLVASSSVRNDCAPRCRHRRPRSRTEDAPSGRRAGDQVPAF
jgi:uncharacterized protein